MPFQWPNGTAIRRLARRTVHEWSSQQPRRELALDETSPEKARVMQSFSRLADSVCDMREITNPPERMSLNQTNPTSFSQTSLRIDPQAIETFVTDFSGTSLAAGLKGNPRKLSYTSQS